MAILTALPDEAEDDEPLLVADGFAVPEPPQATSSDAAAAAMARELTTRPGSIPSMVRASARVAT